jgi:hypothetical protein
MFGHIFAYLELATGIIAAVGTLQHIVQAPGAITGEALMGVVNPVLFGIQGVFPKLNIPMPLVTEIVNSAATAINTYYKKGAAA